MSGEVRPKETADMNMPRVIRSIENWATNAPEAIAVQSGTSSISFQALWQRINELAEQFRRQGVRVLALAGDNHPQWLCADLAAFMAKLTLIPVPTFFSDQQVQHIMQNSGADHLLTLTPASDAVLPGNERIDLGQGLYLTATNAPVSKVRSIEGIVKITYTSGSTGQPKGVCLNAEAIDRVCRSLTQAINIETPFSHLCTLPLATLLENVAGAYCALIKGQCCIIPSLTDLGFTGSSKLDLPRWMATLAQEQPGTLILTPELLKLLVLAVQQSAQAPSAANDRQPLPSLQFIAVGGGKVSPTLIEQAQALGLPVFEGYGLSECGSVVAVNVPGQSRPGSVGKPLSPGSVTFAEDSEILVSGDNYIGYLDQLNGLKAPTAGMAGNQALVHTGDYGYLDDDGYLYVSGRKKNLIINSFGRNISPEWVESEFSAQPGIFQVAVFGDGEAHLAALLTCAPNLSDTQVQCQVDAANQRLPDFARIASWQRTREPFSAANKQLTANGRLRRSAIAEAYKASLGELVPAARLSQIQAPLSTTTPLATGAYATQGTITKASQEELDESV